MSGKPIPTKASSAASKNRKKPMEGSINMVGLVISVIEGRPSQNNPNQKTPGMVSFITCEEYTVPYIHVEPKIKKGDEKAKNILTKAYVDALPPGTLGDLVIQPGTQTHLVSQFNMPDNIKRGGVYHFEGVYVDAYQDENMDEPSKKLQVNYIGMNKEMTPKEFLDKIPYANKSIVTERDVYKMGDSNYLGTGMKPWYVFAASISGLMDDPTKGHVTGSFPELGDDAQASISYTPYDVKAQKNLDPINALTGGRIDEKQQKATFFVRQVDEEGSESLYRTFTRVYDETGLNALQVDWKKFGEVIVPHIRGTAVCTVDRDGTAQMELEDADQFDGNLAVNTILFPDVADMAKSMGFKIDWDTACGLDERLKTPENVVSVGTPVADLTQATGVNILQYSGNCSVIPMAMEKGYVDLYVICNMPMSDEHIEKIKGMDGPDALKEIESSSKMLKNFKVSYAIFAVTTETSPCAIHDWVSCTKTPTGKMLLEQENKKQRVEEEEEE